MLLALCAIVCVVLSALEELEQNLHLVGVLLEAAQQGVVSHHRLQHVGVGVVVEHVLLARCDRHPLVQHLLRDVGKTQGGRTVRNWRSCGRPPTV